VAEKRGSKTKIIAMKRFFGMFNIYVACHFLLAAAKYLPGINGRNFAATRSCYTCFFPLPVSVTAKP